MESGQLRVHTPGQISWHILPGQSLVLHSAPVQFTLPAKTVVPADRSDNTAMICSNAIPFDATDKSNGEK